MSMLPLLVLGTCSAEEHVGLEDEDALGRHLVPKPVRAHQFIVRKWGEVFDAQRHELHILEPASRHPGGGWEARAFCSPMVRNRATSLHSLKPGGATYMPELPHACVDLREHAVQQGGPA